MIAVIEQNSDGFWVAIVDGKEVTKQNNIVAASHKLWKFLKGQS